MMLAGLDSEKEIVMILYVDVETAPNPAMEEYVEKPTPATRVDAPKNYKNQDAIARWIAKENGIRGQDYKKRLERMALDVDYAMVTDIAMAVDDNEIVCHSSYDAGEEGILRMFWRSLRRGDFIARVCGFNVLGFDLPIIMRRSFALGIRPSRLIDTRKYSTDSVIDLMQILYNWGNGPGPRARGLKAVCAMYGIENKFPELDGSMVGEMSAEQRREYAINDVEMTRELARRTRGYYWD